MDENTFTQRLAALSPAKRALFEFRLKQKAAAALQTIPRRASREPCPLSFAQQRLWFLNQLEPGNSFYNEAKAVRLTGPLKPEALQKALDEIVRRHEVLRSNFGLVDGSPVQIVAEHWDLKLPVIDLRTMGHTERDLEIQRLFTEAIEQPFDLSRDLLVRSLLIRVAESEHVFLTVRHHIASDGWSLSIFSRELAAFYEAFSSNKPHALAELPIQYADYAVWQRQWLQGELLQSQLRYWKEQLADVPVLKIPADRSRPAVSSYRGGKKSALLPKHMTARLKALSRAEGVTLFMSLLAAFQTLLYRYTGQEDIAVGSPIANRTRPETEGLIGFFVNTLVLRSDLSGDPTFTELLSRVRKIAIGAYEHQDLPFEKLVEELNPERNLSPMPLFQVMFALQNAPVEALEMTGIAVSSVDASRATAKFDLFFSLFEEADGLRVRVEYSTDLYDADTIGRMVGHFETLLGGIVNDPHTPISKLPLLTEAERHRLIDEWNDTSREYPSDKCIHKLFETQATQTPNALAVIHENNQLSYAALNHRANQLAHYLQKRGVGPNTRVAICLRRSTEMIVGILGILKAGGSYVPLDPQYPEARLVFMLEDTGAALLLTQKALVDDRGSKIEDGDPRSLRHGSGQASVFDPRIKTVCLDSDWESIAQENGDNLNVEPPADTAAYVDYTSGSTGQAKGIAVPHRAVTRLVINTDYVRLIPSDVMAQASNVCFDAATFEIWGALLNGATLVIMSEEVMLSPPAIAQSIEQHGITVMFLTTALFNQLAERIPLALAQLSHLLFGGEAVDAQRVGEFVRFHSPKHLLHVYGPTETTTFASWYSVIDVPENAPTVPIGRPIANTEIYVLDKDLQPVPIGVPGELHIGGDGLALGYLNQPELTAHKFIPHPFKDSGARLYKTGDLARYLPDGNLEFSGRVDYQVKLRGYRIEPEEIESILRSHPAVRDAVIVMREDTPGDKRLVAYLVPGQNPTPSASDFRQFLDQSLPSFMVPSAFVVLDALPLTRHHKVDRSALPVPDYHRLGADQDYVAPRTPIERTIAEIWAKVLNLDTVGIHDNFFDSGGHSLLGVKLFGRLKEQFSRDFPVRWLFETPTVAGLAARLQETDKALPDRERAEVSSQPSCLFELKPGNGKYPVFFFPGGFGRDDGEFLIYAKLAHYVGDEFSFYGLRPRSADGKMPAQPRVEQMAADYLQEIKTRQPKGPYFLIGNCIGGVLAYEIAQQLLVQGQKIALLALMDTFLSNSIKYFDWRKADRFLGEFASQYRRERLTNSRKDSAWRRWPKNLLHLARFGAKLPRLLRMVRIQESYITTLREYKPKPYPGSISLIVNEESARSDQTLGWSGLVSGKIDIYRARGDHDAYIREHVQDVAGQLRDCLEKATRQL